MKGRDCIEKNFGYTFYYNTTCEGIYADVQFIGNRMDGLFCCQVTSEIKTSCSILVVVKFKMGNKVFDFTLFAPTGAPYVITKSQGTLQASTLAPKFQCFPQEFYKICHPSTSTQSIHYPL